MASLIYYDEFIETGPCIPGIPLCKRTCKKDINKDSHNKLEHAQVGMECCKQCGKSVANIKKHMKSHNPDKHVCQICLISLTRSDNLKRHIKLKHGIRDSLILPFMRMEQKLFVEKSQSAQSQSAQPQSYST